MRDIAEPLGLSLNEVLTPKETRDIEQRMRALMEKKRAALAEADAATQRETTDSAPTPLEKSSPIQ